LESCVRAAALLLAGALIIVPDAFGASRRLREANDSPDIYGWPSTVATVGKPYSFQPTVVDEDGPRLQFRIWNKPAWADFDYKTGRLSGQPSASDVRRYEGISISVSDGIGSDSLPTFTIRVASAVTLDNGPPSISGSPATSAFVGQLYAFAPLASDPDGDALTFTASNVPAWATFDARSGKLYGTPANEATGVYANIGITVSDGTAKATLPAFSITVGEPPNVAPRISGTPPSSVAVGGSYGFRPSASDADSDPLTFAIANKPAWAAFDPRTGALSGTPEAGHAGNYPGIVISVSDGALETSLPTFDITVMAKQYGAVSLTWDPPELNTDGTPVENLGGYKVFYGTASRQYTNSVPLADAALTSITIEQLEPATWYFAVKAIGSSGAESDYSQEVSKIVQ
jgi:hypothetical protein